MKPAVLAALVAALVLPACAPTKPQEPRIVTQIVQVPVPVRCDPQLGPEPDYPDTDAALLANPEIFVLAQILSAGRILRKAWSAKQAAALQECRGVTP